MQRSRAVPPDRTSAQTCNIFGYSINVNASAVTPSTSGRALSHVSSRLRLPALRGGSSTTLVAARRDRAEQRATAQHAIHSATGPWTGRELLGDRRTNALSLGGLETSDRFRRANPNEQMLLTSCLLFKTLLESLEVLRSCRNDARASVAAQTIWWPMPGATDLSSGRLCGRYMRIPL